MGDWCHPDLSEVVDGNNYLENRVETVKLSKKNLEKSRSEELKKKNLKSLDDREIKSEGCKTTLFRAYGKEKKPPPDVLMMGITQQLKLTGIR